jgi:hypothetical protein
MARNGGDGFRRNKIVQLLNLNQNLKQAVGLATAPGA